MTILLTVSDVARQLQIGHETVRCWLRAGKLKGIKPGSYWRIMPEDLDKFITKGEKHE